MEELVTLINQLKLRGTRLALVTGSHRTFYNIVKQNDIGFFSKFDVVVTGDDTVNGKPHPDPYDHAVSLLDIAKENCVVVENAPLGVQSARSADLFTIGFLAISPLSSQTLLDAGANAIAHQVADLRRYLMWLDSNITVRTAIQFIAED